MKKSKLQILTNGIIKENPILVLILGTCPFLAVTTQASNAIGGATKSSTVFRLALTYAFEAYDLVKEGA